MGKQTRKQKKLRGGFLTKERRGVIGNWWGNCDGIKMERLQTRCLLDQERSFIEAHFHDPMAIYTGKASETFKAKLAKTRKEGKRMISDELEDFLELYGSKAARDEARRLEKLGASHFNIRTFQRNNHGLSKQITLQVEIEGDHQIRVKISNFATVGDLKTHIANKLNILHEVTLYYGELELNDDSFILYDLGIKNGAKLQVQKNAWLLPEPLEWNDE